MGKTSVGSALKTLLAQDGFSCVHLDGDELRLALGASEIWNDQQRRALGVTYVNLAESILRDVDVVIVTAVANFKEVYDRLSTCPYAQVSVTTLTASWETLLERDDREIWRRRDPIELSQFSDEIPTWVDYLNTDSKSPQQCASNILANLKPMLSSTARSSASIDAASTNASWWRSLAGRTTYWDHTYEKAPLIKEPSPFALFVCGQLSTRASPVNCIAEFGCGDGRDASALAQICEYTGWDISDKAIASCQSRDLQSPNGVSFFSNSQLGLEDWLGSFSPDVIYSRFVLHAMNAQEQENFFAAIKKVCSTSTELFLECRAYSPDQEQPGVKLSQHEAVFGHYRRFVDATELGRQMRHFGFEVLSLAQSRDWARTESENPTILRARAVLRHSRSSLRSVP